MGKPKPMWRGTVAADIHLSQCIPIKKKSYSGLGGN
jgi:hypothetical protein